MGLVFWVNVVIEIHLGEKPDGARFPKFAVDIRVPAIQTGFVHIDAVLAAFIARFALGVIHTMSQLMCLLVLSLDRINPPSLKRRRGAQDFQGFIF